MTKNSILLAALSIFISLPAVHAKALEYKDLTPQQQQDYFRIQSVTVSQVDEKVHPEFYALPAPVFNDPCASRSVTKSMFDVNPLVVIDQIINIGTKVWKIVEANKPVVTTVSANANALPRGIACWADLSSWQRPKTSVYNVQYHNYLGMTVVDFNYRIGFTYGGRYRNQGQYITNAYLQPAQINVVWGFKFDSKAEVTSIVNTGTSLAPVAGMQVQVQWHVQSWFNDIQKTDTYFLTGQGDLQKLQ